MAIQYGVPGLLGDYNETTTEQNSVPGFGDQNETVATAAVVVSFAAANLFVEDDQEDGWWPNRRLAPPAPPVVHLQSINVSQGQTARLQTLSVNQNLKSINISQQQAISLQNQKEAQNLKNINVFQQQTARLQTQHNVATTNTRLGYRAWQSAIEDDDPAPWQPRRRFHRIAAPPIPFKKRLWQYFVNENEEQEVWYPIHRRLPIGQVVRPGGQIATQTELRSGFSATPLPRTLGDSDPLWVAVEIDRWDTTTGAINTLRLGNAHLGPITRTVNGALYEYEPRLRLPILLGTTLSANFYNQPLQGQPNSGTIVWAIDADFKPQFDDRYHWLGQPFRVYEGRTFSELGADVDADLTLIYTGQTDGLQYDLSPSDGPAATLMTTDASSNLNKSIVDDIYPSNFPIVSLQGKPRPQLWGGRVKSIEPVLEDQANLIYRVSRTPLDDITEVRVGGVLWRRTAAPPPKQGEWFPNLFNGTFQLGATTTGADVRCDAQAPGFATFDTAEAFRTICGAAGVPVDATAMAQLRVSWPALIGYYTDTNPVLGLDALNAIAFGSTCWWAFGADAAVIAGFIAQPDPVPDYALIGGDPAVPIDLVLIVNAIDPVPKEIMTLDLGVQSSAGSGGGLLPPAWRVRVEYERRWSPETSFLGGVTEVEQARLNVPGLVADWPDPFLTVPPGGTGYYTLSPFDGTQIRRADPRAEDIYIKSLVQSESDAHALRIHLIQGVTGPNVRKLYDVTAWLPNSQVKLFQTIYFMWRDDTRTSSAIYFGGFRVLSAIMSIGGGPTQLQLWGNTNFVVPPAGLAQLNIPPIQTFTVGQPPLTIGQVSALISNGTAFTGTITLTNNAGGLVALQLINGVYYLVTTRTLAIGDVGTHSYTVSAAQNGALTMTGTFNVVTTNMGWRVDITVPSPAAVDALGALYFNDPVSGILTIPFEEYDAPTGVFFTPAEIAGQIATGINAFGGPWNLSVLTTAGSNTLIGAGTVVIQQSPWRGTTVLTGTPPAGTGELLGITPWPPLGRMGWRVDIAVPSTSTVGALWALYFDDPATGVLTVVFEEYDTGLATFQTIEQMLGQIAAQITASGGPWGLSVVVYNGVDSVTGSGSIIIEQTPWRGTTVLTGVVGAGEPGTIGIVAWP